MESIEDPNHRAEWLFKIVEAKVWHEWPRDEPWPGTALDRRDGYVHLSTWPQVAGTLAKHYAGREGLVALALRADRLPPASLRWEPSRGGALFPHLYAPLDPGWVEGIEDLGVGDEGRHALPKVPRCLAEFSGLRSPGSPSAGPTDE